MTSVLFGALHVWAAVTTTVVESLERRNKKICGGGRVCFSAICAEERIVARWRGVRRGAVAMATGFSESRSALKKGGGRDCLIKVAYKMGEKKKDV